MPDGRDHYRFRNDIHLIKDPIVADPEAITLPALEGNDSGGKRLVFQGQEFLADALPLVMAEAAKFFFRVMADRDAVLHSGRVPNSERTVRKSRAGS